MPLRTGLFHRLLELETNVATGRESAEEVIASPSGERSSPSLANYYCELWILLQSRTEYNAGYCLIFVNFQLTGFSRVKAVCNNNNNVIIYNRMWCIYWQSSTRPSAHIRQLRDWEAPPATSLATHTRCAHPHLPRPSRQCHPTAQAGSTRLVVDMAPTVRLQPIVS